MCPICDTVLTPEWGNVNKQPTWRLPDHPNPRHPDYSCVGRHNRLGATDHHRAARRLEVEAVRSADGEYQRVLAAHRARLQAEQQAAAA